MLICGRSDLKVAAPGFKDVVLGVQSHKSPVLSAQTGTYGDSICCCRVGSECLSSARTRFAIEPDVSTGR